MILICDVCSASLPAGICRSQRPSWTVQLFSESTLDLASVAICCYYHIALFLLPTCRSA